MRKLLLVPLIAAAMAVVARPALGASITPTYTTFGTLAGATFGGSGIPNDAVAITDIALGTGMSIRLGITAFQRFANPPISNDGAGTFEALPGANNGEYPTGGSELLGTTWGFGYYVDMVGSGVNFENYDVVLLYDLDPGAGTEDTDLGQISIRTVLQALYLVPSTAENPNPFYGVPLSQITHVEDAQNLLFSFFAAGGTGITLPTITGQPGFTGFDPYALGQYTLALRAVPMLGIASTGSSLAAIQVNVGAVPEPGTLTLLGFGLLGAAHRLRRRGQAS